MHENLLLPHRYLHVTSDMTVRNDFIIQTQLPGNLNRKKQKSQKNQFYYIIKILLYFFFFIPRSIFLITNLIISPLNIFIKTFLSNQKLIEKKNEFEKKV